MSLQVNYEKLREEINRQVECLPIWIGCKIYEIHSNTDKITERTVSSIRLCNSPDYTFVLYDGDYAMCELDLGKTIFLTKEDAKKTIMKRKVSKNS